ncbi:alpha/beta hydrolase-fold protein [Suttonella ornithocola]|uniref:Poly(3-hydroxybutyrate) depolymerase n=1 Tax=Suttonella ornithocola TaxID=279832 RepID=A0A380MPI7_9GAMM|nr:alpha/beta hydrolase-fold protein [Suttonella ornithocola]SUO93966.1 Poly(3-hydroxybutyrate) depolymerase [Suttonella ornithocola]
MFKKALLLGLLMMSMSSFTAWDKRYGGVDKSYDQSLLELREQIAPEFQTLIFHDEKTGREMTYSLYIPKNLKAGERYPLVQFIADASTVGKGAQAPLKQGYGAIIWATPESQSAQPAFVFVPSFTERAVNDDFEHSEEVDIAHRLLQDLLKRYPIDEQRLYATGQSMGGMIAFYLNATYPDLFAASIYVGSQWDIRVLRPLLQQKFFYIVAASDDKASRGLAQVRAMLEENKLAFDMTELSAHAAPLAQQNAAIEQLLRAGNAINLVTFSRSSVLPPADIALKGAAEHMYSFDYAYQLKSVRDWLFKQHK